MAIDLMFKVPLLLRILIAIEKGARHFEFDFEMIFFLAYVVKVCPQTVKHYVLLLSLVRKINIMRVHYSCTKLSGQN